MNTSVVSNLPGIQAETLDLSRLPPPDVIEQFDYLDLYAEFVAEFKRRWETAREKYPDLPDLDVLKLETDPVAIAGEAWSFVRMLDRSRVNDAAHAVMLAFASGSDLEHLGAMYGVSKHTDESNEAYRRRVLLAPEALAPAGTLNGYIYHALTAAPTLTDATARRTAPGKIAVTLMGSGPDGAPTDEELRLVRAHFAREDIKPATDMIDVTGPKIFRGRIRTKLVLLPGPDAGLVVSVAQTRLDKHTGNIKRLGRNLRRSAINSALFVEGVESVEIVEPQEDIVVDDQGLVVVDSIDVQFVGRDR